MSTDFDAENRREWAAAIARNLGEAPPVSAVYPDPQEFPRVLAPFMAPSLNHTMLPGGGGTGMEGVARSHEPGCMELRPSPWVAHILKPRGLRFEHFPESPWNSFFLLESVLDPDNLFCTVADTEHQYPARCIGKRYRRAQNILCRADVFLEFEGKEQNRASLKKCPVLYIVGSTVTPME